MATDFENLLMCLFGICVFSLVKCILVSCAQYILETIEYSPIMYKLVINSITEYSSMISKICKLVLYQIGDL